jgi:hypothetical protein
MDTKETFLAIICNKSIPEYTAQVAKRQCQSMHGAQPRVRQCVTEGERKAPTCNEEAI